MCDDDVAAFLLVPHADEKFTDVAPAVRGVASSCVEDLAFPGEGGVESPCRPLVKSYTLAGVQHMCGTSNPPPSASRAVAAFQPQCADPLAAVFLRRLYKRDPPVDKAGSRECHHGCQPPTVSESAPAPRAHRTSFLAASSLHSAKVSGDLLLLGVFCCCCYWWGGYFDGRLFTLAFGVFRAEGSGTPSLCID